MSNHPVKFHENVTSGYYRATLCVQPIWWTVVVTCMRVKFGYKALKSTTQFKTNSPAAVVSRSLSFSAQFVNLQTVTYLGFHKVGPIPPFPSLPSPFPSPPSHPLPPFPPHPLRSRPPFAARESGGALKLPQRVWAEPGHQTHFGAF